MDNGRWVVKIGKPLSPGGDACAMTPVAAYDSWMNAAAYAESLDTQTPVSIEDTERREVGDFDWDRWYDRARAAGVPDDVALLGRAVYRESYQHGWSVDLMRECGWEDDGEEMLSTARKNPNAAKKRWGQLTRNR